MIVGLRQQQRGIVVALRPSRHGRSVLVRGAWAERKAKNAALAWQVEQKKATGRTPSEFDTAKWLRAWRVDSVAEFPDLEHVVARVFEYVAQDLAQAWSKVRRNLSAWKKAGCVGKKPGDHPHFERHDPRGGGFGFDGTVKVTETHVILPKMGGFRIMPNRRPAPAIPKTTESGKIKVCHGQVKVGTYSALAVRVTRRHGEFFASFTVKGPEVEPVEGPREAPTVGLDWGVRKLATLSDGTTYANPRALERVAKKALKAHAKIRVKVRAKDKASPPKKGLRVPESRRLKKARAALAKQHKRAADVRENAVHHATKAIVARGEAVAAERLHVTNMTRRRVGKGRAAKAALNRRILDAAPGRFLEILAYKLEAVGLSLTRVNPAYTSQTCSSCRERTNCGSNETFTCASCGSVMDRDVNAAKNILYRATHVEACAPVRSPRKRADSAGKTESSAHGTVRQPANGRVRNASG